MYENFADGIIDPDDIEYCPVCGKKVYDRWSSGAVTCECGFKFFVVSAEDNEETDVEEEE